MDEIKKERTSKSKLVTRRTNELSNAVRQAMPEEEITEKINTLKWALGELGMVQDSLMALLEEQDQQDEAVKLLVQTESIWYDKYDLKVNNAIKAARKYIVDNQVPDPDPAPVAPVAAVGQLKVKKLEVPTFASEPKDFHKWKETFERYTKSFDAPTKYDYLFNYTTGEAHTYVANRREYQDAMDKLDEKYGNVHDLIATLIDEIKRLTVTRKNDLKSFENLSLHANEFHDRLVLMGKEDECESSYILKEIEGKLCSDDYHKWLESRGKKVDERTVKDLLQWLELQTRLRRIVARSAGRNNPPGGGSAPPSRRPPGFNSNPSGNLPMNCRVCNEDHRIPDCPVYLNLVLNDRWEKVKELRTCFQCLESGHRRQECTAPVCSVCNGPHHVSLHRYVNGAPPAGAPVVNPVSGSAVSQAPGPKRCFLPVVKAKLATESITLPVKAALDSYSELNIITSRCCERLKLKGTPTPIAITGAGGVVTHSSTLVVEVDIIDDNGERTSLECIVFDKACGKSLRIDDELLQRCKDVYKIDTSRLVSEGGTIDILVGQSKPGLHRQLSMMEIPNDLAFVKTRFGPCIVGTSPRNQSGNFEPAPVSVNSISILTEAELSREADNFREILKCELAGIGEEPGSTTKSTDDVLFDRKMEEGMVQDIDGRLKVDMPWNCDPNKVLKNNRTQAIDCDVKLMRQLEKDPIVQQMFNELKEETIKEGIWKKVDPNYPKRYLPLITVVNMEKESSKIRVCLDSKRKFQGVSLNDALLKGSFDAVDIFRAITKARSGKYTLIGDMKKMFWQVKMSEEDQRFHGIVCGGETYVFTRVCYGDKPSPSIADYSMRKIAQAGKAEFPAATTMIEKKRYVDDFQDANSHPEELVSQRDGLDELLGRFGFEIKEWLSNHPDVGNVKDTKLLGCRLFMKDDLLAAAIGQHVLSRFSKAAVLSSVNAIWDPIGILEGIRMIGKLIFQSIVRMKSSWEEELSDNELRERWEQWCRDVKDCDDLKIDRSLLPQNELEEPRSCVLVGFSDGSSVAYGCTLYLRWADKNENNVEVKFVGAKGKVNPIKGTTIPRSETCGAFLLSRLAYSAEKAFEDTELKDKIEEKVFFTDSTTVLSWTKSGAIKFKPFVKNKIIEMQELHAVRSWNYLPRAKNTTADLVSKGCTKKGLQKIIDGPDLLQAPREEWNFTIGETNQEEEDSEKVHNVLPLNVEEQQPDVELPIDVERYSTWGELIRVTKNVFLFGTPKGKTEIVDDPTTCAVDMELKKAEMYWLKIAQKDLDEKKIQNLMPFVDQDGIVRANGRLKESNLFTYEQKHPAILPKNHKVSELIVQQAHKDVFHAGYARVVAEVRKKYWIVGVRGIARRIGRTCVVCRRWRGKAFEQTMRDLPSFRLKQGQPFETSSVDYFGPFDMKTGYRRKKKAFGAVFTCLATRAVQVELVTDLTTQSFLLALTRFIARWDQPKEMRSDNGRNFLGAANEIKRMLEQWKGENEEKQQLNDFCNKNGFKWTFSTPLASHHNGCVESMIKSVKLVLNKIVNRNLLNEEEYRTVFAIVTNSINSRPLYPATDDSMDIPITCNDLLRPTGTLSNDPEFLNDGTIDPRTRYQLVQSVANEWWQLWMSNFAPNLQPRNKWFKKRENVVKGDIVLLIDKDRPRSQWCMGLVNEVYPGSDGLVRSVRVKTSTGVYDRPITKLTLLLSKDERIET